MDVQISNPSNDNELKNGIRLANTNGTKDNNNIFINPEVLLSNSESNTQISMGIGLNNNDENLKIIASKINIGTNTYLKPLNNFSFSLQDIGTTVDWTDSNVQSVTINNIVNDSEHGIVGVINRESPTQVRNFGYQIGYVNRQNFSYIRTDTGSNLSLGTNGMNILNITNTGDVGVGIETPN